MKNLLVRITITLIVFGVCAFALLETQFAIRYHFCEHCKILNAYKTHGAIEILYGECFTCEMPHLWSKELKTTHAIYEGPCAIEVGYIGNHPCSQHHPHDFPEVGDLTYRR